MGEPRRTIGDALETLLISGTNESTLTGGSDDLLTLLDSQDYVTFVDDAAVEREDQQMGALHRSRSLNAPYQDSQNRRHSRRIMAPNTASLAQHRVREIVETQLIMQKGSSQLDLTACGLTDLPTNVMYEHHKPDCRRLLLQCNFLSSIPIEVVSELSRLKLLDLSCNIFCEFPPAITALTSLHTLWMHQNALSSIPPSVSELVQLQEISLQGNLLASVPAELFLPRNLRVVRLGDARHGNPIAKIPQAVGRATSLQVMDLRNTLVNTPGLSLVPKEYRLNKASRSRFLDAVEQDTIGQYFGLMIVLMESYAEDDHTEYRLSAGLHPIFHA